jgi:hypothetical protein
MESIEDTIEELNEIMENLDLGNHRVSHMKVPSKISTVTQ